MRINKRNPFWCLEYHIYCPPAQGMDPVNERRVFDLIVNTTSSMGSHSSQYFILTPKVWCGHLCVCVCVCVS